jgi:ATP-dependent DNA helicase RecG
MNRLLQGDVGSGKTIVAVFAMLKAVEAGFQASIMAPTEILAEQHYLNIHGLVEQLGLRCELLTGSRRDRPFEDIASGKVHIVIGTHALIQEGVVFHKLGLVVIDEQHRFGVLQRAALRQKGQNPHVLVMTATPIPRTLSLTLYGDLDYSVLDELPPNRTPVVTKLFRASEKRTMYAAVRTELNRGHQAYIVYPLIEESEKMELLAAKEEYDRIKKVFPEFEVGLLHGRMRPQEKESVMRAFKEGRIHVLVCTTVVEVGVDVPNATVMVIEHAERFGLSQLHQLRGRVGRGASRSYCFLVAHGRLTDEAFQRLRVMVRERDGFRIAEEDFRLRGPGELFGTRQSGMPDLKSADLMRDTKLLAYARQEAFSLIETAPELSPYPALRAKIEEFWRDKLEIFRTS